MKEEITGMTRETLHKLLDIAIDGAYSERHSIVMAIGMMSGGIKAYAIGRGWITKEEAETI